MKSGDRLCNLSIVPFSVYYSNNWMIFAAQSAGECPLCPEGVWRGERLKVMKLCLKRDALPGSFLFTVVPEMHGCIHINLFGESVLFLISWSHTHTHAHDTHARACFHLGMNGRLTFRTVSEVQFYPNWTLDPPPPPPPPLYSSTAAAVPYWYYQRMQMNVLGVDQIPHWLQKASRQRREYWIPRHQDIPEFNTTGSKKKIK